MSVRLPMGYYLNSQQPLDKRMIVNNLANANTEIPLHSRYAGMIAYMRDMNGLYWLDQDMYTWHRLLPIDYDKVNQTLAMLLLAHNCCDVTITDDQLDALGLAKVTIDSLHNCTIPDLPKYVAKGSQLKFTIVPEEGCTLYSGNSSYYMDTRYTINDTDVVIDNVTRNISIDAYCTGFDVDVVFIPEFIYEDGVDYPILSYSTASRTVEYGSTFEFDVYFNYDYINVTDVEIYFDGVLHESTKDLYDISFVVKAKRTVTIRPQYHKLTKISYNLSGVQLNRTPPRISPNERLVLYVDRSSYMRSNNPVTGVQIYGKVDYTSTTENITNSVYNPVTEVISLVPHKYTNIDITMYGRYPDPIIYYQLAEGVRITNRDMYPSSSSYSTTITDMAGQSYVSVTNYDENITGMCYDPSTQTISLSDLRGVYVITVGEPIYHSISYNLVDSNHDDGTVDYTVIGYELHYSSSSNNKPTTCSELENSDLIIVPNSYRDGIVVVESVSITIGDRVYSNNEYYDPSTQVINIPHPKDDIMISVVGHVEPYTETIA